MKKNKGAHNRLHEGAHNREWQLFFQKTNKLCGAKILVEYEMKSQNTITTLQTQ